jgi:regulator of cell morphogenesis and NO signaling
MKITHDQVVGELVAEDYRTAAVFQQAGIDFCCRGNRSIRDVCQQNNVDEAELMEAIEAVMTSQSDTSPDFRSWPLDLLADYIEKKHHRYVTAAIASLVPFLTKVVKVHGDRHPELKEVEREFHECVAELTSHMSKEEQVLFPYIRHMVSQRAAGLAFSMPSFHTLANPIAMMEKEHDGEGERFRRISALTNQYQPPVDACNTYRVLYSMLKEFEEDLHLHIHLENNILFPGARRLDSEWAS